MNKQQSLSILTMCHVYMEMCEDKGLSPAQHSNDVYNILVKEIREMKDD